MLITEGLGSCNTKERKYIKQDPYTMDNTVLKMAKKRAFVDATLLVGSLSDLFTQDIEDMDLNGVSVAESNVKVATDNGATITEGQAKRLFAISKGNAELVKKIISKYGYKNSKDITKVDYNNIVAEVENAVNDAKVEDDLPDCLK
jgi:protein tyrosine phosphatase